MAYSYYFHDSNAIDIDEYVDWIETHVDLNDEASILESAPKIHQLANNPTLLDTIITSSLKANVDGLQRANIYTDATFILALSRKKSFLVRANVWKTPQLRDGSYHWENQHYSYLFPHDHNFDFLTVGYHGSGYRTEIYEYDPQIISGHIGEQIDLRFLEDTRLERGKVMFFRKSRDVHIQHPPETLSISLNLITKSSDQHIRQQYQFDVANKRIEKYVTGDISLRVSMINIAAKLGGEAAINVLEHISVSHQCPRTRQAAFKGLLASSKYDNDTAMNNIKNDPSKIVRSVINNYPLA